jgi:hypothetical protein
MYGFFHAHSPVFAQYQYAEPLYGCQGLFNSYALSLSRTTLARVRLFLVSTLDVSL